jgi:uncharacterized membrane protein YkoI
LDEPLARRPDFAVPPVIGFWLLIAVLLTVSTAGADSDERRLDHEDIKRLREAGVIVPLETILARFRDQQSDGRLLEVELEFEDGRYVYGLVILQEDGTVRELEYDARSGRFWRSENDEEH